MSQQKKNTQSFTYLSPTQQQQLTNIWKQVLQDNQLSDEEYVSRDVTIIWLQKLSEVKQIQQTDYQKLISQYLQEIHQLDQQKITNIQFRLKEALSLVQWYRAKNNRQQNQVQHQQVTNQHKKTQQNKQSAQNKQLTQNKQLAQNNQSETYIYPHNQKQHNKQQPINNATQNTSQVIQQPSNKQSAQNNDNNDNNDLQEDDMNQFGLQASGVKQIRQKQNNQKTVGKNYKEYLRLVFDHYCRMSYATGNDPTFQQIQHKANVMTINKFMMFCKQFSVVKLNSMSRSYLLELFRKNAELYKQMNFQQFIKALVKISQVVFNQQSNDQPSENSKQFEQLLLFLQVNNFTAFKKKMQSLNIAYRPKNITSNIKKPQLKDYKFKYAASNGRAQQQVKEEIIQRKKIRSEQKLKFVQKNKKARESQPPNLRNVKSKPSTSSHKQKLAPPKPPARRVTADNGPRNRQQNQIVGYANIYKMKKNKNSSNSRLKLNSIVQDAKKMVDSVDKNSYNQYIIESKLKLDDRDTPLLRNYQYSERDNEYSDYSRKNSQYQLGISGSKNLSQMSSTPYRYEADQYSRVERQHAQKAKNLGDLGQLLGSQEEDDEYLNEHLHRQRKNDHITKRIQAKINEIDYK